MFSLKNISIGFIVFTLLTVGLWHINGMYLNLSSFTIPLHTELLYDITGSGMGLCVALLVFNLLAQGITSGGLGLGSEDEPADRPMSLEEMWRADKEDAEIHNQRNREIGIATGGGTYEDYNGWLRDAYTNLPLNNNGMDQRRVIVRDRKLILNPNTIRKYL